MYKRQGLLAAAGLRMLAAIGWGLELERCVRCGRACEPAAAACLDPGQGGLVCRACGGARIVLRGERRARLAAAQAAQVVALTDEDAAQALAIVEDALAAHAGIEPQG